MRKPSREKHHATVYRYFPLLQCCPVVQKDAAMTAYRFQRLHSESTGNADKSAKKEVAGTWICSPRFYYYHYLLRTYMLLRTTTYHYVLLHTYYRYSTYSVVYIGTATAR